jgi:ABC-type transporter Mla subunit MlaD
MEEKKTSKIHDIKQTASNAVEIMRQIGTPGVQDSLNKVKETATIVNEIIQGLKTPEIVKNIENLRLISENMNEASTKMQNTMQQLRETGVIDEATELIKSTKGKIDSFDDGGEGSINGQDLRDVSTATKEMLVSIKDLMNELKVTVASSKKSETIRNVKETIKEASDIYSTTIAEAV